MIDGGDPDRTVFVVAAEAHDAYALGFRAVPGSAVPHTRNVPNAKLAKNL
jgi:hypothetical protein